MDWKKILSCAGPHTSGDSKDNSSRSAIKGISRRAFLFAGAGLAVGSESLASLVDELTSLLDYEEAQRHPDRGESLPADLVPPSVRGTLPLPTKQDGHVFLTFDDGPLHCTGKILDLLASTKHKATFFVIGRQLKDRHLRAFAVRALREGHDIGNHSFSHPDFSTISAKRAEKEIVNTHNLIQEVIKESEVGPEKQDLFFRFPYGVSGSWANYAATQNVLASLDYRIAFWDLDTNDWRMELAWFPTSPRSVLKRLSRAKPRDVILLHDRQKTAHCLPQLMETLDSHKLVSVPLSDYWAGKEMPKVGQEAPADSERRDSGSLHPPDGIVEELLQAPLSRLTVRHDLVEVEPVVFDNSPLW